MDRRPAFLSVAICTYNRAASLDRTLRSLVRQETTGQLAWELLLIDNNSTDATAEVAESFAGRLPLRYVFEPEQGLSAARNRALREFQGELLIFTDDDVVIDSGWLGTYQRACVTHPEAGYFGGRILPLWEKEPPRWLTDPSLSLISGLLVYYDLGAQARWFEASDPLPFGANFAIRRSLASMLEPFRLDLGVKGGSTGRGEEAEYLSRARREGARGVYLGDALCLHTQVADRFRMRHLYNYGREKGLAEINMGRRPRGSRKAQMMFVLRGLRQLLKGRGDRFRQCVINIGIQQSYLKAAAPAPKRLGT